MTSSDLRGPTDPRGGPHGVPGHLGAPRTSPAVAPGRGRQVLQRWLIGAGVVIVFLTGIVVMGVVYGSTLGPQVFGLALGAALLPVGIVVPAFLWLDRFEHEPPAQLLLIFAWGALVATTVALVLNTGSMAVLSQVSKDGSALAAVAAAPVIEEALKGLGVLIVFWVRPQEFDGVMDGLVYAGVCAAGFAFAENILYLGQALADEGPEGLIVVFVLRCILGPFAHPLFTCCTGVGIGIATMTRSTAIRVFAPMVGFLAAVCLHAGWNLSSVIGLDGFVGRYLFLQLPIFLGAIAFAILARKREAKLMERNLTPYADSGWLTPAEVAMLTSLPARRSALTWAGERSGKPGRAAMHRFQDAAGELAFLRERVIHRGVGPDDRATEAVLLSTVGRSRSEFLNSRTVRSR